MKAPDNSTRAKQRARYMILAAKHRERAVLAGPGVLAESYVKLAEGFDELAKTMEKLDLFPMPRADRVRSPETLSRGGGSDVDIYWVEVVGLSDYQVTVAHPDGTIYLTSPVHSTWTAAKTWRDRHKRDAAKVMETLFRLFDV